MQVGNDTNEVYGFGWLPEEVPEDARFQPVVAAALPTHFDWRAYNGYNWMTSVKNQGGCGSCVAFGAVGATEAQHKIAAVNPSWNLDLSEQHLFSCGGGQCGYGWYISAALNRLRDYGTPDEACYPYQARDGSCSAGCSDWQSRAFKIASWNWVTNNPSAIEAALMNGPLVAGFFVYSDFFLYKSGVYHYDGHSAYSGGHSVVIVGYDSVEEYWIAKNVWGSEWEESGYFRIGFGEADIENYVASITVDANAVPPPPPPLPPPSPPANVFSVTVQGAALPGISITVDRIKRVTPFTLEEGWHVFSVSSSQRINGIRYYFRSWQSPSGVATSKKLQTTAVAGTTIYAVYEPAKYTVKLRILDAATRKAISGASVYLDGAAYGVTDRNGRLNIGKIYAGVHSVVVKRDGYSDFTGVLTIKSAGTITLRF